MSTDDSFSSDKINVFTKNAEGIPNTEDSSLEKTEAPINDALSVALIDSIVCSDKLYTFEKANSILSEACTLDGFQIAYSEIYKLVKESETRDALVEDSLYHCQQLFSKCQENESKMIVSKISEHVRLCQLQISQIFKLGESIREGIRKEIDKASQEISKGITSQLIGVVSIFTALAFILFGGISGISSLTDVISLGQSNFTVMLVCFLLFALIMLGCICLFIYFVINIVNKNRSDIPIRRVTAWVTIPIAIVILSLFIIHC